MFPKRRKSNFTAKPSVSTLLSLIVESFLKRTMSPSAPLLLRIGTNPALYKIYSPNKNHRNEQNPSIDEKGYTSNEFSLEFIYSPSVQWIKNQLTAKVTQTFSRC